jgi:radical SAM protein with 4Fe4S-binding SPASM domain
MVTNAKLWRKGLLEELQETGLASITFSLDGPRKAHTWLRNDPASYDKVIEALADCAAANSLLYDVVTCVHPGNLTLLDETASILIHMQVPSWRLFRIFPIGRAASNANLFLSHEDTENLFAWIIDRKPFLKKQGLEVSYSCEFWFPGAMEKKIRTQPSFCRAGVNIASILSDGTITGCPNNHSSFAVGNIMTDSFSELWRKSFIDFRKRPWLKASTCSTCKHVHNCMGGPIHMWDEKRKEPIFCWYR